MQNNEIIYKYTMSWKMAIFLLVIGVLLSIFSFGEASSNTQGMIINGIIELGVTGASIFLWCLFLIMVLITLIGMYSIYEILRGKTKLVLNNEGLLFPTILFKKDAVLMLYQDISDLGFMNVNRALFLTFKYNGKKRLVAASRFQNDELFNEFTNEFSGRVLGNNDFAPEG